MASYIGKGGQVQAGARPTGGGGLTSGQKGLFALAAVLVGPSLLKTLYEKPKEAVDLSSYNIVTRYDTPGAPLHSLCTASEADNDARRHASHPVCRPWLQP